MIKKKYIKHILDKIIEASEISVSREICGYLGYDYKNNYYVFQQEENSSPDPQNFFSMDPYNYLKFRERYDLLAVFHSHVIGDANPSNFDIKMAGTACTPFLIYSINSKKFQIYCPPNAETNVNILNKVKEKI